MEFSVGDELFHCFTRSGVSAARLPAPQSCIALTISSCRCSITACTPAAPPTDRPQSGGRHLDTTVTTAEAIAEVAGAVGRSAEVYVDGGIRRGTDIVKALALGARAVLVGRPPLWGLSVSGAAGVQAVMQHLHDEMIRAMQLCGAGSLAALTPDLVKQ